MSIAVIVPVLDEAPGIEASLQRLLRGHHFNEIIVVDGGSDDDTVTRVQALAANLDTRITMLQGRAGRARQMNLGASRANSDILLFLHADTVLPDDAVALIRDALLDNSNWGRFDVRLDSSGLSYRVIEQMMNWRSAISGIATGDQCIFVKRDIFLELGGYADIALMEDIELSRRLKKTGRPARIYQRVQTSARRWQQHGIFRTIVLMWWLRFLYWTGVSPDRLVKKYYAPRQRPELILFAKQPVAGKVKTRLQPQYSAEQCADIAAHLIATTVARVSRSWPGPVSLYVAPDTDHPLFHQLSRQYSLPLHVQQGKDLGARMHHALGEAIDRNGAAAVMGCDVPQCSADELRRAYEALQHQQAVLGPTRDGGYYLVGLVTPCAGLFDDMEWGSDRVLAETLRRAGQHDIHFLQLAELVDIDNAADLQTVAREVPALQQFLQQGTATTAAATGGTTETVVAKRD